MSGPGDAVERYIEEAPEQRRPALRQLRALCRRELDGFDESIEYGMPSYSRAGAVEVAFASQKRYIVLYALRTDVMAAHRTQLEHLSLGKGAIRYADPEEIEIDVVRSMLEQTATARGPIC